MIKSVSDLGLETCVTLGMLEENQAKKLAESGLDFYNHNRDYNLRISLYNFLNKIYNIS